MEDYHLHSLVDDLGVSLADAQSGPVVPCRAAVKRIAAWLSSQGKKLANDKDDPYIKARQRLPETVPLRLMKHLGRRCHKRAEAAWRWCDRTVKSVDGSMVSMSDIAPRSSGEEDSRSLKPFRWNPAGN